MDLKCGAVGTHCTNILLKNNHDDGKNKHRYVFTRKFRMDHNCHELAIYSRKINCVKSPLSSEELNAVGGGAFINIMVLYIHHPPLIFNFVFIWDGGAQTV